jgi:TatD DNase family protein
MKLQNESNTNSKSLAVPRGEYLDVHTHNKHASWWHLYSVLLGKELVEQAVATVGIHPWYISDNWSEELELFKAEVHAGAILPWGIGECGLDVVCDTQLDLQKKVFDAQVALAGELNVPVVLHCVKAYQEVYDRIVANDSVPSWIFHWFSGSIKDLEQLLSFNTFFSFGKDIVSGNKKRIAVLKVCPLDRMLFETDDWDGEISEVYKVASELLGVDETYLIERIYKNVVKAMSAASHGIIT